MKITFEQTNGSQMMDNGSKILQSTPSETGKIYDRRGYKIDISGKVMDNNAYAGQGKTMQDVMQDAALKDVATEHKYMAVMSNSMSAKDFAKLQKDGYQVGHTDIETVVSIVDKIKATLAQSGQVIVGYNDDLSMEELAQITGDVALAASISKSFDRHDIPATEENVKEAADAFVKAMQAPELTGGALKYIVTNRQEPTIENIYLAGYKSVADDKTQAMGYFADDLAGYYGKKADEVDAGNLAAQIEKIIDEAGLSQNEETVGEASWLVENGAVLTADSLRLLHDLKQIPFPRDPEQTMDAIASAIAEGKKPQDASLVSRADLYQQAAGLAADTAQITDEAVYAVIEKEERVSLRSLIRQQHRMREQAAEEATQKAQEKSPEETLLKPQRQSLEKTRSKPQRQSPEEARPKARTQVMTEAHAGQQARMMSGSLTGARANASFATQVKPGDVGLKAADTEGRFLKAKRRLEEIRLRMTAETNIRLLRRGFSIDTAPLKEVVERLRAAEEQEARAVYNTDSVEEARLRRQICEETLRETKALKEMPIDTVGKYAFLQRKLTLRDIHDRGQVIRREYEQAGRAYESMMTAPRGDLGDSIGKAFRNVDFLLEDMGLEVCEANSRAVRILAYNQMPVNRESIAIIKNADLSLRRVIEKLTPANTLYMVRDGVNPLEMNLEELYDYLKNIPQTQENAAEKFGKFIYKLDKKKGITKEEREACIGVFRLIRQVEKGDFRSLGAVVDSGQSLSLMNLLKAVRTRAAGRMDYTVDDTFAGMAAAGEEENLITQQIGSYYAKRIDQIYEHLEPEKLLAMNLGDSATVEELADTLEQQAVDEELDREYQRESLQTIRQAAKVSDETVSQLLEGKVTVNADYLLAADYLRSYRGTTMRRISSLARTVDDLTNREMTDELPFEQQLEDAVSELHENMGSSEGTRQSYQSFLDVSQNLLSEAAILARTDRMDMQSMVMYMKQMQFLGDMSKEENYEIPLTVGDEVTSLNLRIVHNKGQAGQVSISLQTMELSNVWALFTVEKDTVRGVIASGSRDGLKQLEQKQEQLAARIEEQLGKSTAIRYVYTNRRDAKLSAHAGETDKNANTNNLYRLAKSVIMTLKEL